MSRPLAYDGFFTYNSDVRVATIFTPQLESLQPGNIPFETPPYNGYPELGLSGSDYDLNSGSYSYRLLVGSTSTPRSSAAQLTSDQSLSESYSCLTESAVWYPVNAATGEIRPQWINSDGSKAPTYLGFATSSELRYFVVAGDLSVLASHFNNGANIPIRFNLDTVDVPV